MNVVEALDELLEEVLCVVFLELSPLSNIAENITSLAQLHHKRDVLGSFKTVIEADNVMMVTLLQNCDFLHDPLFLLLLVS